MSSETEMISSLIQLIIFGSTGCLLPAFYVVQCMMMKMWYIKHYSCSWWSYIIIGTWWTTYNICLLNLQWQVGFSIWTTYYYYSWKLKNSFLVEAIFCQFIQLKKLRRYINSSLPAIVRFIYVIEAVYSIV